MDDITSEPDVTSASPSSTKKRVLLGGGVIVAGLVLVGALSGGDIIDLPAWANVPGVDLPIVGDKDAIDCRLSIVEGSADPLQIQIDIVDGNEESYMDYQYVWNNGNLVDDTVYTRTSADQLLVPVQDNKSEQFFSVSIDPVREGRVYCESILVPNS